MIANRFGGYLFDLDGVIYVGDEPVDNSVETIRRLRNDGSSIGFVTNTASKTREDVVSKLGELGIEATVDEIVTAGWATARYLDQNDYTSVYLIGQDGLPTEVQRQGIRMNEHDAEAVVVGSDYSFNYSKLKRATRLIHDEQLPFIATNLDPSFPTTSGISPGTGAIVSAVQTATGEPPTVIGKPQSAVYELALEKMETDRVAMLGDTLVTDIKGANDIGLFSILLSKHQRENKQASDDIRPDIVLDDVSELFARDLDLSTE